MMKNALLAGSLVLTLGLSGMALAQSADQPEASEPVAPETPAATEAPTSTDAPTPATEADLQKERDQQVSTPALTNSEAIGKVESADLMHGDQNGQFHPERPLTRAELATILVKTFKLKEREAVNPQWKVLKDVPVRYWAFGDIHTVTRLGIMEGYKDGYFYPNQSIDRAEALAIFAQAYGVQQYDDQTVNTILANYPDSEKIPTWARKAMATTLKNGFVDVSGSKEIRPMQPMTRGDMAFALGQYLNRLHESEQPNLH